MNIAQLSIARQELPWLHFPLGATLAFLAFCAPLSPAVAFWRCPGAAVLASFCVDTALVFQRLHNCGFYLQLIQRPTHKDSITPNSPIYGWINLLESIDNRSPKWSWSLRGQGAIDSYDNPVSSLMRLCIWGQHGVLP